MNSIVIVLVSDGAGTAMVPLIIVGTTSSKLLNVTDRRCNSAKEVCLVVDLRNDQIFFLLIEKQQ